jgi:hypothetical protein
MNEMVMFSEQVADEPHPYELVKALGGTKGIVDSETLTVLKVPSKPVDVDTSKSQVSAGDVTKEV